MNNNVGRRIAFNEHKTVVDVLTILSCKQQRCRAIGLFNPVVVAAGLVSVAGGTIGGTMNATVHGRNPTVTLAHVFLALIIVQMIPMKATRAIQTFVLKAQRLRCSILAPANVC